MRVVSSSSITASRHPEGHGPDATDTSLGSTTRCPMVWFSFRSIWLPDLHRLRKVRSFRFRMFLDPERKTRLKEVGISKKISTFEFFSFCLGLIDGNNGPILQTTHFSLKIFVWLKARKHTDFFRNLFITLTERCAEKDLRRYRNKEMTNKTCVSG